MTGYELVHLEEGDRAALQARWPSIFPVSLGSLQYSTAMNRFLGDLHNAIVAAVDSRNKM